MSLPIKEIGSVMTQSISAGSQTVLQSAGSVSFESVWNNQTERQNQTGNGNAGSRAITKRTDNHAGESLKSKSARPDKLESKESLTKSEKDDLSNIDQEEWEKAMEVLGAAAAEMIQQVADAFGMTTAEIQELMAGLGLEQFDVLQQNGLSQLILAAGGAESATELLTDEELYQQFQSLMEQQGDILQECSDVLQADAGALVELAVEDTDSAEVSDAVLTGEFEGVQTQGYVKELDVKEAENQAAGQDRGENKGDSQVAADKGIGDNLLLQNLKTENFEPYMQQLSETVSAWDSDTMDIMKQIMDYMKIQIKPDVSALEMQLHPESLGSLQIHVASKGGSITAQFVTQNESVKAALESQMIQLKESFAEQGVKVDAIEVTVQTHQFEQNLEQGRSRQQEESGRKTRPRRIQLDDIFSAEDLNGMAEEEQLTVEMMAANGNTVDYTA